MHRPIYVAATSQHVGKTTCTLGLVSTLQNRGVDVGYCKPVGQEFVDLGELRVDKDALLFSEIIGFELFDHLHSPVILGKGATTGYLRDPAAHTYAADIKNAARQLQASHEMVVYEGTGHPGVGSVVDLSNAQVAKSLDARVMMVVEGGIGSTIDRLHMCTSLFREIDVEIAGVVINKCLPEKIDTVRRYVGGWLQDRGLSIIGAIPYDKTLLYPIMSTVRSAISGRVLYNGNQMDNQVVDIMAGSLIDSHDFTEESGLLLVVSNKRIGQAVDQIDRRMQQLNLTDCPLSGIIITGDGRHEDELDGETPMLEFVERYQIPVLSTRLDTFGSVVKISRIEVKINTRTPWKARRAIELFNQHTELGGLLV